MFGVPDRHNSERPTQCGAWVKLYAYQVAQVRRGFYGSPYFTGFLNESVTCGREYAHGGWHEAGMRRLHPNYGGGEIGIRWKRPSTSLSTTTFNVVHLKSP